MIWHTTRVFQRILSKWPHYRGHANVKTCNHALGTYLYSLGMISGLRLLWMCSTSLHTTHTCECKSPRGSHIPWILSGQANLYRRPKVSETPWCHASHEHPPSSTYCTRPDSLFLKKYPYAYEHTTCMRSL